MDDEAFQAKIQEQVLYWQKVLALQDWNIDVRIVRQWDMSDQSTLAECEWYLRRKDAIIRLLHPSDIAGVKQYFINEEEADYDISLVHELLHLHFAPLDRGKENEVPIEQAINALSRGYVKLYREHDQAEPDPTPDTTHGQYL